jgi:hypothetical protein
MLCKNWCKWLSHTFCTIAAPLARKMAGAADKMLQRRLHDHWFQEGLERDVEQESILVVSSSVDWYLDES